jgi:hypothetical protein
MSNTESNPNPQPVDPDGDEKVAGRFPDNMPEDAQELDDDGDAVDVEP